MDLKKYEKTRYQNIYRNIKNKNYIVMMSKPVKTSIASIDGKKILKLEDALKIRDNYKIKQQKGLEVAYNEDFDTLWTKYMNWCILTDKQVKNTVSKKEKTYNKYLKEKINKKVSKIQKEELVKYIDQQDCSDKQKNEIIKELKAFFNWCIKEEYLIVSPLLNVKKYKVNKTEMKYWTPEQFKNFLNIINKDINNNIKKEIAYRTKIFVLLGFNLGDRVGETRALTFDCFDYNKKILKIKHSINYDRNDTDFLSHTKTYHSQRDIDITDKLLTEIYNYKYYLINELNYKVKDNSIIFFNYNTNKPLSDTTLRKTFYYYCDKAEVSKIRMYDLRHTYVATMMMEGKELYHISERLGHTDYSTTVNKYGHLSNEVRKEIAQITDKYY